jgi:hypothetical protein
MTPTQPDTEDLLRKAGDRAARDRLLQRHRGRLNSLLTAASESSRKGPTAAATEPAGRAELDPRPSP